MIPNCPYCKQKLEIGSIESHGNFRRFFWRNLDSYNKKSILRRLFPKSKYVSNNLIGYGCYKCQFFILGTRYSIKNLESNRELGSEFQICEHISSNNDRFCSECGSQLIEY